MIKINPRGFSEISSLSLLSEPWAPQSSLSRVCFLRENGGAIGCTVLASKAPHSKPLLPRLGKLLLHLGPSCVNLPEVGRSRNVARVGQPPRSWSKRWWTLGTNITL